MGDGGGHGRRLARRRRVALAIRGDVRRDDPVTVPKHQSEKQVFFPRVGSASVNLTGMICLVDKSLTTLGGGLRTPII